MRIALLPDEVVNQIAAGEVIENPASVVKELADNAIDSAARRIEIEIVSGGQQSIRIEDDGCGMGREDLELCLQRHTTSKLKLLSDLDSLSTMGFRGEALAAIAAVSRMEICTSDGGAGWRLTGEGGRISAIVECARNRGTTIEVGSLFFNTPARRKFQKSPQANAAQAVRIVQSLALANPGIAWKLFSQKQQVIHVDAGTWKDRILDILGNDFCQEGIWLEDERLFGWLGPPEMARATRLGQYFFVNRRPIFSPLLSKAVREGYGKRIAEGAHPTIVLFLEERPIDFDVNVHPQKREVRFQDESALFCSVRDAVQRAFLPNLPAFSDPPAAPACETAPWESFSVREGSAKYAAEQKAFWQGEAKGRAVALEGSFLLAMRISELWLVDLREAVLEMASHGQSSAMLMFPIHLTLTGEEAERMEELILRCQTVGIDAKAIGVRQICIDAIPEWLDETAAALFFDALKDDLWKNVPIEETMRRFCRSHPKRMTLAEAEQLWNQSSCPEVRIQPADLERILAGIL